MIVSNSQKIKVTLLATAPQFRTFRDWEKKHILDSMSYNSIGIKARKAEILKKCLLKFLKFLKNEICQPHSLIGFW